MQFEIITARDEDVVSLFANLKDFTPRDVFIAEGEKVVTRLLTSSLDITALYLTQDHFDRKKPLIEAHHQPGPVKIVIAPKKDIESTVGYSLHQGILATALMPKSPTIAELINTRPQPHLFVVLDTIADAENVGALCRTALALNATALIVDNKSVSPWIRRAVRVSVGAVFSLPIVVVPQLEDAISFFNQHNIYTLAAELTADARSIQTVDFREDLAVVFGSEGFGIRQQIIDLCRGTIAIPVSELVDSLNVSVAQGIILYEIARQRQDGH